MRYAWLLAILLGALPYAVAAQPMQMNMECQQNTDDGRLLVANGNMLPANARFRITQYRPTRREDGWTFGPCTVVVTPAR